MVNIRTPEVGATLEPLKVGTALTHVLLFKAVFPHSFQSMH